jgi:alanine racemase
MDYTTIDVTDLPQLSLGETATLLGADGAERIRVEEIAKLAGTIPYEILCSIGKRVKRSYAGGPVRSPQGPALEAAPR